MSDDNKTLATYDPTFKFDLSFASDPTIIVGVAIENGGISVDSSAGPCSVVIPAMYQTYSVSKRSEDKNPIIIFDDCLNRVGVIVNRGDTMFFEKDVFAASNPGGEDNF